MTKWIYRRNKRLKVPNISFNEGCGIFVNIVSWNHGGASFGCNELLEKACTTKPHLLLISSVECGGVLPHLSGSGRFPHEWIVYLNQTLNRAFRHIATRRRQGVVMSLWAGTGALHLGTCELIHSSYLDLSWDKSGRKSSIFITLKCVSVVMSFVVVHFDAGEVAVRMKQLQRVLQETSHRLPRSDIVFVVGDMNFRLDLDYRESLRAARLGAVDSLLVGDQLSKLLSARFGWLTGWREASRPTFLPTYKIKRSGCGYDLESRRLPAYTDRILIWSHAERPIHTLEYTRIEEVRESDHFPIIGRFFIPNSQ